MRRARARPGRATAAAASRQRCRREMCAGPHRPRSCHHGRASRRACNCRRASCALSSHEMRGFVVAIIIALQLNAYADPKEDEALRRLDRGIAAFDAKDFATAEREFTAAHDLVPDKANPYRWLALAEIQLGDCKSAV